MAVSSALPSPPSPGVSGRVGSWLAGLALFIVGMLDAGASFALGPPLPVYRLPLLYPPPWVFGAVWVVIYPCLGAGTWRIVERRREPAAVGALAVFALVLVGAMLFLPLMHLAGGRPGVLAVLDLQGMVQSWVLVSLYGRIDRRAAAWLAPLALWMPVTLLLKLGLWGANR